MGYGSRDNRVQRRISRTLREYFLERNALAAWGAGDSEMTVEGRRVVLCPERSVERTGGSGGRVCRQHRRARGGDNTERSRFGHGCGRRYRRRMSLGSWRSGQTKGEGARATTTREGSLVRREWKQKCGRFSFTPLSTRSGWGDGLQC